MLSDITLKAIIPLHVTIVNFYEDLRYMAWFLSFLFGFCIDHGVSV